MSKTIPTALKLLLTGLATTAVRIIGQLSIPAAEQTVLAPSVFARSGTMPLAFTVYGIFAYSLIASLFLLVRDQLSGSPISRGLKYSLACCAVWTVYLLEPLPHVAPLDRVTYPAADCLALLVMGLLLGWLLGAPTRSVSQIRASFPLFPALAVAACFFAGRMIQYLVFDIYSSFGEKPMETVLWSLLAGIVISCVTAWLSLQIHGGSRGKRAVVLGCLLFGVDLLLFNFFMPLVFDADLPDLVLRTFLDVLAVTLGCLSFPDGRGADGPQGW